MSSKINLQTCEYACKSSIFQDNQLISCKYKNKYHVVYQKDIYTGEQWLEIMPQKASKAQAALQLKQKLECDRLVVFGDGKNDIDMFEIADEAYAVENAVSELKAVATGIIGSNENDGVAKYLQKISISKSTVL